MNAHHGLNAFWVSGMPPLPPHTRTYMAPDKNFDSEGICFGVCLGNCRREFPCPFAGCVALSSGFAGGPQGEQLELDFETRH